MNALYFSPFLNTDAMIAGAIFQSWKLPKPGVCACLLCFHSTKQYHIIQNKNEVCISLFVCCVENTHGFILHSRIGEKYILKGITLLMAIIPDVPLW